ncbi:hypothetical protein BDQ12DRAFT_685538 [Crucibulum laeve]|uniref:Uncharacterized protein n=1 Tax=Crucibulum laeve TaxID=68775 RepID=A0A5C3LXG5_9AGAR|nr:hypothetical protein BDQ12DRAFT_685538 [Crucibulum laeve]
MPTQFFSRPTVTQDSSTHSAAANNTMSASTTNAQHHSMSTPTIPGAYPPSRKEKISPKIDGSERLIHDAKKAVGGIMHPEHISHSESVDSKWDLPTKEIPSSARQGVGSLPGNNYEKAVAKAPEEKLHEGTLWDIEAGDSHSPDAAPSPPEYPIEEKLGGAHYFGVGSPPGKSNERGIAVLPGEHLTGLKHRRSRYSGHKAPNRISHAQGNGKPLSSYQYTEKGHHSPHLNRTQSGTTTTKAGETMNRPDRAKMSVTAKLQDADKNLRIAQGEIDVVHDEIIMARTDVKDIEKKLEGWRLDSCAPKRGVSSSNAKKDAPVNAAVNEAKKWSGKAYETLPTNDDARKTADQAVNWMGGTSTGPAHVVHEAEHKVMNAGHAAAQPPAAPELPSATDVLHTAEDAAAGMVRGAQNAFHQAKTHMSGMFTHQNAPEQPTHPVQRPASPPELPTREHLGLSHHAGVGSLPGSRWEEGVALTPEERHQEEIEQAMHELPIEEIPGPPHHFGVGSLPGTKDEVGVAILPDERKELLSFSRAKQPIRTPHTTTATGGTRTGPQTQSRMQHMTGTPSQPPSNLKTEYQRSPLDHIQRPISASAIRTEGTLSGGPTINQVSNTMGERMYEDHLRATAATDPIHTTSNTVRGVPHLSPQTPASERADSSASTRAQYGSGPNSQVNLDREDTPKMRTHPEQLGASAFGNSHMSTTRVGGDTPFAASICDAPRTVGQGKYLGVNDLGKPLSDKEQQHAQQQAGRQQQERAGIN